MSSRFIAIRQFFLQPRPLQWHVSAPIPAFAALALLLILFGAPLLMERLVKENAVETAIDLTQTLQKIRNYYAKNVLDKVNDNPNIAITHLHDVTDNSIPIPATFLIEMAQSLSDDEKLQVDVTSPHPFSHRASRQMDDFQQYAWAQLTANPTLPVSQFDTIKGRRVVKVALPDRLTQQSCVSCHNSHPDSPKHNWQLGDVRGIVEITVDVESSIARANDVSFWMIAISFVCLSALVLFNLRMARKISRPLSNITHAITELSDRRFADVKSLQCDYIEVRALSGAFSKFQHNEIKRQALESEVHHLAYFDPLTDIPNRESMVRHLNDKLSRIPQNGFVALFIVNIEKFNEVNDTLGYSIGDKVLVEFAGRLVAKCPDAMVSRFSATEFSVVVSHTEPDRLNQLAAYILDFCHQPFDIDEHQIYLNVSIGVTKVVDASTTVEEMIAHANIAVDHAEQSHSDKIVTYQPALSVALHERVAMIKALKSAIENNELVPFFQPQFDLKTNQLIGAEVLLRWIKPDGTMVSPAQFIPVAEKSRLILDIGRYVLTEACRYNKQWQAEGLPSIRIAVNVSGVQFDEDGIIEDVQQALSSSGLDPSFLELEVTETALMADINAIVAKLTKLRALGIELAIDDFGTGYSSLSYLKKLPIDRLKIDQSFIRNLVSSEDDKAITEMILNLGQVMQLKVLAEGIEGPAEQALLRELGCDEAQGFHYAKPMSAQDFDHYLRNWQSQGN